MWCSGNIWLSHIHTFALPATCPTPLPVPHCLPSGIIPWLLLRAWPQGGTHPSHFYNTTDIVVPRGSWIDNDLCLHFSPIASAVPTTVPGSCWILVKASSTLIIPFYLCFQAQRRVKACWPCPSVPIGATSLSQRWCKKNLSSPFMNCHPSLSGSAKSLITLTSQFRDLLAWLFLQTPNTCWLRHHLQNPTLSIGCGKNRK